MGFNKYRNAPCSCGSGKKYKNCCLRNKADSFKARREAEKLSKDGSVTRENQAALEKVLSAGAKRPVITVLTDEEANSPDTGTES